MANYYTPSTFHVVNPSNPKILIVGAGLGGLTLAILLEKACIDYEIYERSTSFKPQGCAISLAPSIMPLLDQLGLLEDLKSISKDVSAGFLYKESSNGETLDIVIKTDFSELKEHSGYYPAIMARSDLHSLLLSQVPLHKIHLGKRILSISQDDERGVIIWTSDGMTHEGDILVGCDGTYSGVRQALFKLMSNKGLLPASDEEDMKVCHMSVHGTTHSIDPRIVPYAKDGFSRIDGVIGHNKPQSWRTFEVPGNRICWRVDVQLPSKSFKQSEAFRNTDWGSESCGSIDNEMRSFKLPLGVNGSYITVGDLINATDKENITKIMMGEKLYTTWHHGRTVLIGDACHKMLPSAGRGAINAMLDAVVLANLLYEIGRDATGPNIKSAFNEYYDERYNRAKADLQASQKVSNIFAGQTWTDDVKRKAMSVLAPASFSRSIFYNTSGYRPQASFLPKVEYHGSGEVEPQKESMRYLREKDMTV